MARLIQVAKESIVPLLGGLPLAALLRVAALLVGLVVVLRLLRPVGGAILRQLERDRRLSDEEAQQRAATLVRVALGALRTVVWVGAILALLGELGISLAPLLAAAGVVGVAIAFGAQNLVRDFLSGFFILLEDQYSVGDIVKIGEHGGVVERLTLRMTGLRDVAGTLHLIPNGEIKQVSNLSHTWSRAVCDVTVAYGLDPDRAIALLGDEAAALAAEERWAPHLIDRPEVVGIDALGDSGVTLRVLFKTRPQRQWEVKREFQRRVLKRLAAEGLEIPLPQRTVWLRSAPPAGEPSPPPPSDQK